MTKKDVNILKGTAGVLMGLYLASVCPILLPIAALAALGGGKRKRR